MVNRCAGVLMHLTSLPGPEGIGSLGRSAAEFVDFLASAGVSVWQVLPVGPVGASHSPYQSPSTHAGNPMLIDLDALTEDGLLDAAPAPVPGGDTVDFERVCAVKSAALERAYRLSRGKLDDELSAFRARRAWVDDYALFMAIRESFGGAALQDWPDDDLIMRRSGALAAARAAHRERIGYHVFVQYLFDQQWRKLKFYANMRGVKLFGDLPIYVAADSADLWANPSLFKADAHCRPRKIAGVPPDCYSEDGQLWGNPIYDWKVHRKSGYRWWIERMRTVAERFDIVRLDHFIGFANYYQVASGAPDARSGTWKKGPGIALFRAIKRALPTLQIVAEDLGIRSRAVVDLRKECAFPGMAVALFAFDGDPKNGDLPRNIRKNRVAYTGTHDNDTALGWWNAATPDERRCAIDVLGLAPGDDFPAALIDAVMASRARMAVIPMQDYLGLSGDSRMNLPGTAEGNWGWRMRPGAANGALAERIAALVRRAKRAAECAPRELPGEKLSRIQTEDGREHT